MSDHQPQLIWKNSSSQQTTLTLSTLVDTGQWYYLVAGDVLICNRLAGIPPAGTEPMKVVCCGLGVGENEETL